jgi:hypothetical protein
MRGTIGGAPICLPGIVGFATVAIGVGPFVCVIYLSTRLHIWPGCDLRSDFHSIHEKSFSSRLLQAFWN